MRLSSTSTDAVNARPGCVVSFMPTRFITRESLRYPLNRRQSWSGCFGKEKILLPLPGTKLRFLTSPARSLVTILTELFWSQLEALHRKMCVSVHSATRNCSSNECCNTKCNCHFKVGQCSCNPAATWGHYPCPFWASSIQSTSEQIFSKKVALFHTGGHWFKSWPMNEICLSHFMQLLLLYMSAVHHSLILVSLVTPRYSPYTNEGPLLPNLMLWSSHTRFHIIK